MKGSVRELAPNIFCSIILRNKSLNISFSVMKTTSIQLKTSYHWEWGDEQSKGNFMEKKKKSTKICKGRKTGRFRSSNISVIV